METLSELLVDRHVALDVEGADVTSCLHALVQHLVAGREIDEALGRKLDEALLDREKIGGTCVGVGVAVPHAYFVGMPKPLLLIGRLKEPIDYQAPDGKPVDLLFLLAGPLEAQRRHVKVLARIARLLHDARWLKDLRMAKTAGDVVLAVQTVERRHV